NTNSPLGLISGVAPGAYLGNYRVLDALGHASDFFVAQALEEAVNDGFDIANISLGAPAGSMLSFLDMAVDNAVAAGMTVVVAAGNDGDQGDMTINSPGTAPYAITVAATSNGHFVGPSIAVTGPSLVPAELQHIASTQGLACTGGMDSVPYFDESRLDKKKRGCRAKKLPPGSLTGSLALIQRGDCTFVDKINNAAAAGAAGAIVFNKDISEGPDGGDTLFFMDTTGTSVPSFFIGHSAGLALRSWFSAHADARVTISEAAEFTAAADLSAAFSSMGPTTLGPLKPDLAGPGESIYSGAIRGCNPDGVAYPSGFLAIDGTSAAAPHVTGSAALIKQLHSDWTPEQIKSALVNSAEGVVFSSADQTAKAGVLQVGAGRLNVRSAASIDALFSP